MKVSIMYEICAISDTGKVRKHNEDCLLVMGQVKRESLHIGHAEMPFLLAVADGVGGADKGEVASLMALSRLAEFQEFHDFPALSAHITGMNRELCAFARKNPGHSGMGTTLAGVICLERRIHPFHAGDSRVYRFRDGFLRQLTTDHTLVQSLYAAGKISRDEMATHPNKNVIVKVLGGNCERPPDPEVDEAGLEFRSGDILLVCSDGLSDMASLDEMEEILGRDDSLSTMTRSLIQAANAHGGEDNVTVVLCAEKKCHTGS